jgi:hypothetical protein
MGNLDLVLTNHGGNGVVVDVQLEHTTAGPGAVCSDSWNLRRACTQQAAYVTSSRASTSMDGRGRWMDNVFIERLWCSLKYECLRYRGNSRCSLFIFA